MSSRALLRHGPRRSPARLAAPLVVLVFAVACSGGDDTDASADADDGTVTAEAAPDRPLTIEGPEDGALLNAEDLDGLQVSVQAERDEDVEVDLDDLRLLLDGEDVTGDAEVDGARLEWAPVTLEDGERTIAVASEPPADTEDGTEDNEDNEHTDADDGDGEPDDGPEILHRWEVTVDATPPRIELTEPDGAVIAGEELTVAGTTQPGAEVTIGDDQVTADDAGAFELVLDQAPEGALELEATDPAGNTSGSEVSLVSVPSRVETDEIRSVHVSFCAWSSSQLLDPILELVEDGTITAVQLDLKDESGKVGYDSEVELVSTIGADTPDCGYDLAEAVERLHAMDVPVIGRIVAFADPVLANWAWDNGEHDMVMQNAAGEMYTGRYSGFANFANEEVVDYNVALAEEAAAAGVDHILWDYIRKPDGDGARFPGLEGDPQDAVVDFTRRADEAIAPYGAKHGASVYGISADRPAEVAQNIPGMADHLDYMAPMIYPSHWGPGEYGVADPLNQPYDMIRATLEVWTETTEGKRARIVPWLEDSEYPVSIGGPDRATYITEQLRAAYDLGIEEWILWDSSVDYTTEAIYLPDERG